MSSDLNIHSSSIHHHHPPVRCLNPASEINGRLDTQVEVKVYPCNNSQSTGKKKYTTFNVKPEGVLIQGINRNRGSNNPNAIDLGVEYSKHIGRKVQRYELSDTRACAQLLVTSHNSKSFYVVPAPETFSRHSGTCRLLGDRKHPQSPHTLQVGDFLRVGSVGIVVIETHDGTTNRVLSEERIQKIMKDTTSNSSSGNDFLDMGETDGENSDDDSLDDEGVPRRKKISPPCGHGDGMHGGSDSPVCYMCFDGEEDSEENPLITPCKCRGDTQYVHVECLRKWHTAEADNQICFLSSVDATCSVCKSTFRSDFKMKDGRLMKLFKSSLEPPYVSLLVATKHEMAQRLFNTRFQLSFSTLLKPDGRNGTRPLTLGRSSGSDMVLDYRTVSARHATIRFKNGEFIFTDAGSSNGSYLYLRRPVELTPSQTVQFRLGRSMISMKVVNKWNRRLLRAVRNRSNSLRDSASGGRGSSPHGSSGRDGSHGSGLDGNGADDHSIGSNDDDVRIINSDGTSNSNRNSIIRTAPRRTRESIMNSLPPPGELSQQSSQHLDLLYALAYPKRGTTLKDLKDPPPSGSSSAPASGNGTTGGNNNPSGSSSSFAIGRSSASLNTRMNMIQIADDSNNNNNNTNASNAVANNTPMTTNVSVVPNINEESKIEETEIPSVSDIISPSMSKDDEDDDDNNNNNNSDNDNNVHHENNSNNNNIVNNNANSEENDDNESDDILA